MSRLESGDLFVLQLRGRANSGCPRHKKTFQNSWYAFNRHTYVLKFWFLKINLFFFIVVQPLFFALGQSRMRPGVSPSFEVSFTDVTSAATQLVSDTTKAKSGEEKKKSVCFKWITGICKNGASGIISTLHLTWVQLVGELYFGTWVSHSQGWSETDVSSRYNTHAFLSVFCCRSLVWEKITSEQWPIDPEIKNIMFSFWTPPWSLAHSVSLSQRWSIALSLRETVTMAHWPLLKAIPISASNANIHTDAGEERHTHTHTLSLLVRGQGLQK